MTYRVNDSVEIAIFIEDQELILGVGNALHSLHIVGSTRLTVPTLKLHFSDTLGQMTSMKFNDGVRIQVLIRGTATVVRNFRVFSWSRSPAGNGFSYTVDGVWDCPKYFMGTTSTGIRGTSLEALSSIASQCNLAFRTTSTSTADPMLWIPANKTFGQFARSIARYGYIDEKSHMVYGMDTTGTIRYRDINRNQSPTITVGYIPPGDDENFHLISDFHPSSRSGLNNALLGYRHERYMQSAVDGSASTSQLVLVPDSKYPALNMSVRDKQERGTVSYSPINFGNTHQTYEQARYQNSRFDVLNGIQGEFVFPYQTGWELCDNFNYVGPSGLHNPHYDGEFTVTTKVVFIAGSQYSEKVVAVRNGLET